MKREHAERTVAYVNSECKEKLEKAIKDTLGVSASLEFELKETSRGYYIKGRDCLADTCQQMTATPLLRQLFSNASLRVECWDCEDQFVFGIALYYDHNYKGGSNGHDLMAVSIMKTTGEVIIQK